VRARRGEPAAARERLAAARAIFAGLGARMDIERVEHELAGLSQDPSPSHCAPHAVVPCVSAAQWTAIAALLPRPARMGRPRADDRRTLEAILYQRRTGCAWASLPAVYGDGATAHRRRCTGTGRRRTVAGGSGRRRACGSRSRRSWGRRPPRRRSRRRPPVRGLVAGTAHAGPRGDATSETGTAPLLR
jgi:hypothetical protein